LLAVNCCTGPDNHLELPALSASSTVTKCPRRRAIIFSDLSGKLAALTVACPKCWRFGHYSVSRLIESRGSDYRLSQNGSPSIGITDAVL
jgi:hypothetical protein